MKIKTDFVTNSSSISYICVVPRSFNIREVLDMTTINKYDENGGEELTYEELEKIISEFESVRNGNELYRENSYRSYDILNEIVEEKDFIISSVDGGPDENKLIFLDPDLLKEKLIKIGI